MGHDSSLRDEAGNSRLQLVVDTFERALDCVTAEEKAFESIRIGIDGDFSELDVAPPGGALEQPWFSTADVDGDVKRVVRLVGGTPFQRSVWKAMLSIPHGGTIPYAELAGRVGAGDP